MAYLLDGIPSLGFQTPLFRGPEFMRYRNPHEEIDRNHHNDNHHNDPVEDAAQKMAGYVPVFGTFVGIARIKQYVDAPLAPNRFKHIARGCIELFSFTGSGGLLLVADLFVTLGRLFVVGCRSLANRCMKHVALRKVGG